MAPSGVPPPKLPVGVAELAGATAPAARYDVTASAAVQVSVAAALEPAAPASPTARAGLLARAAAARLEPMGGEAAGGRPVIGEPMSAGGRVRREAMTGGVRRGEPMTGGVPHGEPISVGPVRGASERKLGRSDPEMRHHRMLASAGHVEPNPRR
ncbi:MAG TPA: hypothetical protein VGL39_05570 [Jatrophihabitantaceae bacterium]